MKQCGKAEYEERRKYYFRKGIRRSLVIVVTRPEGVFLNASPRSSGSCLHSLPCWGRPLPPWPFLLNPPHLSFHFPPFHLSAPQWNGWGGKSFAEEETELQTPAGLTSGVILGCSSNVSQPHCRTCLRKRRRTSAHSGVRSGVATLILGWGRGGSRLLSFPLLPRAESACPCLSLFP